MNSQSPGPADRRAPTMEESGFETARNTREHATPCRLPDQRELVAAFSGAGRAYSGQPLLSWAHSLANLHRRRHGDPLSTAGIDCRRAELVALIDRWAETRTTPRRTHSYACSLGAKIDRMAAAHVHANHLLHSAERVADERVHAAWYRLALLADEWTDLVTGAEPLRHRR
ncbi:DUF4254 domain-containing protein [Nocardia sp. X0981]